MWAGQICSRIDRGRLLVVDSCSRTRCLLPAPSLLLRYPDPGAADWGAMAANESLDAIIAALGAILMAAPQGDRQRLAQAIEDYAARFPTAYRDMREWPSSAGAAGADSGSNRSGRCSSRMIPAPIDNGARGGTRPARSWLHDQRITE
jgi:hypothetical protein